MIPPYHPVQEEENQERPVRQLHPGGIRITCGHLLYFLVTIAVIVLSVFLALRFRRRETSELKSLFDPFLTSSIASQASQCGCPYLTIFPFDTGCPANCTSHRIDLPKSTNFYKTSSAFVFGNLTSFRQQQSANDSFQAGPRVAQSFIALEKAIIDSVAAQVQQAELPPLSVHRQSLMHMSLDYLCCLTEQEKVVAQEVRDRFVADHYNNFPLQLGRVHCLQERTDSVTLIWMAGELEQKLLMRANYALANAMRAKGVPVLVERSLQMPFHVTLIAFRVSRGQDISRYRKVIQAGVEASGSHSLKTHVTLNIQSGPWELARSSSEINYPKFVDVENAKWYVQEVCDG